MRECVRWMMSTSVVVLALASANANAQTEPGTPSGSATVPTSTASPDAPALDDGATIEEIVVTAQKRSENLQRVPIAITAFTEQKLTERNLNSVAALSNLAPSVNLDAGAPFSGSSQVLGATIRGVGQQDFAANVDPGVGVYLDGVYLARTVGANLDLPDVQRIEVLKGPQGTLFGRNTIGGAISVVTKDPEDTFGGSAEILGGRFNHFSAKGYVSLPIEDTLRLGITFATNKQEGWQKRIAYPSIAPIITDPVEAVPLTGYETNDRGGGADSFTVRAKMLWEPSSTFQNRISVDYTREDTTATANSLLGYYPVNPQSGELALTEIYNACITLPPAVLGAIGLGTICGPRGTPLAPERILPGLAGQNERLTFGNQFMTNDPDTTYATGPNFAKITSWGVSNVADFDLAPAIALKSITGYRELDWVTGLDGDASPIQITELGFSLKQHQFSQELQATGSVLDDRLKYVVGGYYFSEKNFMNDYVNFDAGILQIYGPNRLSTKNFAFYTQLDYKFSDLLSITLGGRYTSERKTFNGGQADTNGLYYKLANGGYLGPAAQAVCTPLVYGDPCATAIGIPDPSQPLRFYPADTQRAKYTNFSPKAGVQIQPMDNVMLYGTWSRGYKTGGWTTRLTAPNGSDIAPSFTPEKLETFEVGIKSELLDRRLKLNLAAYTSRYQDVQLNLQVGVSPTIRNAGNARIRGIEAELSAVFSESFSVDASASYTDAQYTSVLPGFALAPNAQQAGVFVGADLPKTPKWKANISPRYSLALPNDARLLALVQYTYTSKIWNDSERTYLIRRPNVSTIDASLTYNSPKRDWYVAVGGTNILNKRYLVTGLGQFSTGLVYGTYNEPAQWYGKLGFNF